MAIVTQKASTYSVKKQMQIDNNDDKLGYYAYMGNKYTVEEFFDKGVSVEGFRCALLDASRWGRLDVVIFLLNNGEDMYNEVKLALKETSPSRRKLHNEDLIWYLKDLKSELENNFIMKKRYNV